MFACVATNHAVIRNWFFLYVYVCLYVAREKYKNWGRKKQLWLDAVLVVQADILPCFNGKIKVKTFIIVCQRVKVSFFLE